MMTVKQNATFLMVAGAVICVMALVLVVIDFRRGDWMGLLICAVDLVWAAGCTAVNYRVWVTRP